MKKTHPEKETKRKEAKSDIDTTHATEKSPEFDSETRLDSIFSDVPVFGRESGDRECLSDAVKTDPNPNFCETETDTMLESFYDSETGERIDKEKAIWDENTNRETFERETRVDETQTDSEDILSDDFKPGPSFREGHESDVLSSHRILRENEPGLFHYEQGGERLTRLESLKMKWMRLCTAFAENVNERIKRRQLSGVPGQVSERREQKWRLVVALAVVGLICYGLGAFVTERSRTKSVAPPKLESNFRIPPAAIDKESFQEKFGSDMESVKGKLATLEGTLETLTNRVKKLKSGAKNGVQAKEDAIEAESRHLLAPDTPILTSETGISPAKPARPRMGRVKIRQIVNSSQTPVTPSPKRSVFYDEPLALNRARGEVSYLPAGSFVKAVVLSGVTAPTGGTAMNNPIPMLLELTDLAVLPNRFRSSVKRCFMTANATGDISSERVWIRLDRLSCMREDAKAVDVKVQGYVTGEDGKTGVRARLVTRSGQAIANALFLGAVSGLGKAVSMSAKTTTTYSSGASDSKITNAWKSGIGDGIDEATDRIVDYYIKLADKIFPVLEVDSGRTVDVVLSQGVSLGQSEPVRKDTIPIDDKGTNASAEFGQKVRGIK